MNVLQLFSFLVLLSTFVAAFIFSVFGAQPLCIAGVTGAFGGWIVNQSNTLHVFILGPITVFNKTIFTIITGHPDSPDYLHFVGWVYLWSAILHIGLAIMNGTFLFKPSLWVYNLATLACNFLKYVTLFSCDTFGFYVSWVSHLCIWDIHIDI